MASVTDTIDGMAAVLEKLGHPETVGICLDTGNSWLGGAEPLDYVKIFGKRIQHVHWKDMPESWLPKPLINAKAKPSRHITSS